MVPITCSAVSLARSAQAERDELKKIFRVCSLIFTLIDGYFSMTTNVLFVMDVQDDDIFKITNKKQSNL